MCKMSVPDIKNLGVGVTLCCNDQGWSTTPVNIVPGSPINGVLMFPWHDHAI